MAVVSFSASLVRDWKLKAFFRMEMPAASGPIYAPFLDHLRISRERFGCVRGFDSAQSGRAHRKEGRAMNLVAR